MIVHNNLDS